MEEYYPILMSTSLFRGISLQGLEELLQCFRPQVKTFHKGEILLLFGYESHDIGIILEGQADGIKNTPDGAEVLITHLGPGDIFGDVLSGSSLKSPVTILARTDCKAVFFPYQKIIHPCHSLHYSHNQLMQNLVATISEKYFALNRRVDLLILKSLRAKLCTWLLDEAARQGKDTFSITLNRAGLADYLNCERSALSRELNRMQNEGLIELYKSSFKLLDKAALANQAAH